MVYGVLRNKAELSCSDLFIFSLLHMRFCIIAIFMNVMIEFEYSSTLFVFSA